MTAELLAFALLCGLAAVAFSADTAGRGVVRLSVWMLTFIPVLLLLYPAALYSSLPFASTLPQVGFEPTQIAMLLVIMSAVLLRFPVMSLVWLCVLAVCFMAGTFLVDYLGHRRKRDGLDIKQWLQGRTVIGPGYDAASLPAPLDKLLVDINTLHERGELRAGGIKHLVLEAEERLRRTLNGSRILVKVAPSLGLVGTLIPMGASLASMAAGNLEAMASEMVVAFTTTIIGLAVGTAAYVINASRQSWVNQIIREQRFLAERALTELEAEADASGQATTAGVTA